MKHIDIIHISTALMVLAIASVAVSCKGRGQTTQTSGHASGQTMVVPDVADDGTRSSSPLVKYNAPLDTGYYEGPYTIDRYFGWDFGKNQRSDIPDIPGLVFKSSCRRHLGVRCPNDKAILKWTSERVKRFADWCLNGPSDTIPSIVPVYERPKSAEDMCNHYYKIVALPELVRGLGDEGLHVIEQFAELLVDVYEDKNYVTMQEATWYDCMSCGDNTTRSWITIDRKTGKQLELCDIVKEDRMQDFAYVMIKHLNGWGSPWFDYAREIRDCDLVDLLKQSDGCALVQKGVVVYYHPYNIGCGAEGQFNALVPYEEIINLMKVGR